MIAPQANIILYEANSSSDSDLIDAAVVTAESNPNVSVISMSFGGPEFNSEGSFDSIFTSSHVTFLAATGDTGSPASYPSYSPNVIAVGGTTLSTDSSAATIAVHSGQPGTAPTLTWTAINPNSDGSSGVVGNSIANGVYDITLTPADVTSDANPSVTVQPRPTDTFFRLFGDINGNRVVNAADNFQFKAALSTYNAAFDYNDDGVVNAADNFQFKASQSYNFSASGIVYTI